MRKAGWIWIVFMVMVTACRKEEITSAEGMVFHPLFKVNVLFPIEGLGDRSFVDDVYEAVELVTRDIDFEVEYHIPESIEEGEAWLHSGIQSTSGSAFYIIAGNQFVPAINALEGNFNGNKLLLLEGIGDEYNGLASILYYAYAPSYVAGYLSSGLTPGCRAASISGFDAPFLAQYIAGFEEGVHDAGGSVGDRYFIADDFSGFEMPDSAYRLTEVILDDYDLIYGLATGSNFGIINALRDCAVQKYAIGINSDQSWMGYQVVTGSVVNNFKNIVRDYLEQFHENRFQSGSFYLSMEGNYTTFLLNSLVLTRGPDEALIQAALQKEQAWWGRKGYGYLRDYYNDQYNNQ